jgi:predicted type IV restriction endonuclease
MEAPKAVLDLVERFESQHDAYKLPAYNETQVRHEFIDPLFEALGWDINNTKGYAEQYKEVVHEDSIKIGGATKAPDYSFRLGGRRLFFLEAKKPAVNLRDDPSPAYQLRRYAWTAKLPVSILTDFEEFIVYDTRVKPAATDKPSAARVICIPYSDYPRRWEEIASLFSPQAIQKGALDKYVESSGKKRGTAEVDDAFLAEIEEWRDLLAHNIALRNQGLTQRELNFAVQCTVDRIVFLRICEDRAIETYGQLMALLNGADVYARLRVIYERADERYNSGLFHFRRERERPGPPDTLTPRLAIDDKALKTIIRRLYYPESPYEFSVLPAEILGQVYERFLGSVIRLTSGGRAKVEQKPEVRKAGGVYYTPSYIVDYIVKHTVGKLLGGWGLGNGVRDNETEKRRHNGNQKLSGLGDVAGSDESSRNMLPADGVFTERREVRIDRADPAGSGVRSSEHRRRLRAGASRGLHTPSVDSEGIPSGNRDAANPHGTAQFADSRGGAPGMGTNPDRGPSPHTAATKPSPKGPPTPIPHTPTPKEVAKLRILDPACGSGSFLLGAYQYLLDWHLEYYSKDIAKWSTGKEPRIYEHHRGGWRLATSERKRILLANIYGVDIDPQAVEVTKLSLLLRVLEGENAETLAKQFALFHERALPDLADNIKCGNSLIGPDFYQGRQTEFDEEETYRINAFDWHAEFPHIMQSGGFDAVIGNPPYIRIHNLVEYYPQEVRHYQEKYDSCRFGKVDIYCAFIERGYRLLRSGGILGFIVPNKFVQADYGVGLRNLISTNLAMQEFVDFGAAQVFGNATTYTCLLFLRASPCERFLTAFNKANAGSQDFLRSCEKESISTNALGSSAWTVSYSRENALLTKLNAQSTMLFDLAHLAITGVKTGANAVFLFESGKVEGSFLSVIPEGQTETLEIEPGLLFPYWKAESMKRYINGPTHRLVLFPYELKDGKTVLIPESRMQNEYPRSWDYLCRHRRELEARQKGKLRGPSWYGLSFSSSLEMFFVPKIVTPTLAPRNSFSFDDARHIFPQGAGGGAGIVLREGESVSYIMGLLNSRLLTFLFQRISSKFQGNWYAYEPRYLSRIPVHRVNLSDPRDKARHDKMVSLVQRMLDLHKRLQTARTDHERGVLERQIAVTDGEIDRLVYELYELTDEEITIIEGSLKK